MLASDPASRMNQNFKPAGIPRDSEAVENALSLKKAQKGIFVTTSSFSNSARETAAQLGGRIVLIDGKQLGRLMTLYNVGCRDKYTLHVKDFDEDFFD